MSLCFISFSLSLSHNPLGYVCCKDKRHVIYGKRENASKNQELFLHQDGKNRKFAHRKLIFTKVVSPCVTFHPPLTWIYDIPLFLAYAEKRKKEKRKKFIS